jgi:hypothetical protein
MPGHEISELKALGPDHRDLKPTVEHGELVLEGLVAVLEDVVLDERTASEESLVVPGAAAASHQDSAAYVVVLLV